MGVVFGMTGNTGLRCRAQVGNAAGAGVALSAIQQGMFSGQGKSDRCMVETAAVGFDPIMAGQASAAVCGLMGLHKSRIDLLMAVHTDGLIEADKVRSMTVLAGEGGAIRFTKMCGQ